MGDEVISAEFEIKGFWNMKKSENKNNQSVHFYQKQPYHNKSKSSTSMHIK